MGTEPFRQYIDASWELNSNFSWNLNKEYTINGCVSREIFAKRLIKVQQQRTKNQTTFIHIHSIDKRQSKRSEESVHVCIHTSYDGTSS